MSLSGVSFLFIFLPVVLGLYKLVRVPVAQSIVLVCASLLFYAWANPIYVVLLVLSVLWNYLAALNFSSQGNASRRRIEFIVAIVVNLLILGFFKYANFLISIVNVLPLGLEPLDLELPVGLSFFTFSAISYLADVYRGKSLAERNLLNVALYISFFGKLTMGPIVQYADFQKSFTGAKLTKEVLGWGAPLFLRGLFKKVVIADQLAVVYAGLQGNGTVAGAWLLAIAYMLQLYFDFSGYSDMAIGASRFFGFDFAPNFNHPYLATSAQDFWRRWHISLSTWFRDYVYIPLGGNRVSAGRWVANIFVVWAATGLWHGANWTFVLWGLYYGVILIAEKFFIRSFLERLPRFVSHIYALLVILFGWVLFMSADIGSAAATFGCMFGWGASAFIDASALLYLKSYFIVFVLGVVFSTNAYTALEGLNKRFLGESLGGIVYCLVYALAFALCLAFMISSTAQAFLYFAF